MSQYFKSDLATNLRKVLPNHINLSTSDTLLFFEALLQEFGILINQKNVGSSFRFNEVKKQIEIENGNIKNTIHFSEDKAILYQGPKEQEPFMAPKKGTYKELKLQFPTNLIQITKNYESTFDSESARSKFYFLDESVTIEFACKSKFKNTPMERLFDITLIHQQLGAIISQLGELDKVDFLQQINQAILANRKLSFGFLKYFSLKVNLNQLANVTDEALHFGLSYQNGKFNNMELKTGEEQIMIDRLDQCIKMEQCYYYDDKKVCNIFWKNGKLLDNPAFVIGTNNAGVLKTYKDKIEPLFQITSIPKLKTEKTVEETVDLSRHSVMSSEELERIFLNDIKKYLEANRQMKQLNPDLLKQAQKRIKRH